MSLGFKRLRLGNLWTASSVPVPFLHVTASMQVTYPEVVAHEAVYKGVNHAVSTGKPMTGEV